MGLMIRKEFDSGYNEVVVPDGKLLSFIEFGILNLNDGEDYEEKTDGKEVVLIILSGRCTVRADGQTFAGIGERKNVFSGEAYSLYIPSGKSFEVTGVGTVQIAICRAPSDLESDVKLICPEDVRIRSVGALNWRRDVKDIIDLRTEASHLVIGETINPTGNWSSAPPHRHDFDNLPEESDMEEVYFYKFSPKQGFGLQRIYTDDRSRDEAYAVEDGDTVILPEGYHPVAVAPGYRLYYLWILAGEKRVLAPRDDPDHAWLKNFEPMADELGI